MSTKQLFKAGAHEPVRMTYTRNWVSWTKQNKIARKKKIYRSLLFQNRPYRREREKKQWVSPGHWSRSTVQKWKRQNVGQHNKFQPAIDTED